jgi:hypothetical protein
MDTLVVLLAVAMPPRQGVLVKPAPLPIVAVSAKSVVAPEKVTTCHLNTSNSCWSDQ